MWRSTQIRWGDCRNECTLPGPLQGNKKKNSPGGEDGIKRRSIKEKKKKGGMAQQTSRESRSWG